MTNPRSAAWRRRPRFLPTPRDRLILEAIRTHGRLTMQQIRRLFFRRPDGRLASVQATNARLLKLSLNELIAPAVVSTGRGSGPYAYALTSAGLATLGASARGRATGGPVWHALELAEIRVRLQEELEQRGGSLAEWRGDDALRALLRRSRGAPMPDALVHWRLLRSEGVFLLELDRGSESLAVLTGKIRRYDALFASHAHRELLPGLGLRPRLAIAVAGAGRKARLVAWLAARRPERFTVAIAVLGDVLDHPCGGVWWRGDLRDEGSLFT